MAIKSWITGVTEKRENTEKSSVPFKLKSCIIFLRELRVEIFYGHVPVLFNR
jgi:hypothetical protein